MKKLLSIILAIWQENVMTKQDSLLLVHGAIALTVEQKWRTKMLDLLYRIKFSYLLWKCERARRKWERAHKEWLKAKERAEE